MVYGNNETVKNTDLGFHTMFSIKTGRWTIEVKDFKLFDSK